MRGLVLHGRYLSAAAAGTTVIVVALVAAKDSPGLGLSHLFYIPIALFALAGGWRVGIPAAAAAVGLWVTAAHFSAVEATPGAIALRAIGFVTIGGLMGAFASEHRELVRALDRLAATDALTGVGNTRSCAAAVAARVAAAEPFGLVMCDVDGLKDLNDTGGHESGDRVLVGIAAALSSFVRTDDAVFRVGGDEFAALLAVSNPEDLRSVGDRLAVAIGARGLSASVGIALFPLDGVTERELRAVADRRMYERKLRSSSYLNAKGQ
jgi:diguanylate cyclase (GGDEF)-like protein